MTAKPTDAANLRGIVALLIAQAVFVTSDSVVKLAGAMMPPTEIMAIRGLIAVMLMGGAVAATIPAGRWHLVLRPFVALRATLEAVLAALFLYALPHLPLANITVVMQVTPLITTVLSALVLSEAVGWRRWLAVGIGFVGVVLVAQPSTQGVDIYVVVALIVAALVAVRDLVTRRLDPTIPTAAVSFATTLSVCLLGFAGAPFQEWVPVSTYGVSLLAASATLVSIANIFIIRAFRGVDVSVVSPFRYAAVVWAVLLGFMIWGDVPNTLAVAGTLIIIASGLYTMHRETLNMRRRSPAEAVSDPHG